MYSPKSLIGLLLCAVFQAGAADIVLRNAEISLLFDEKNGTLKEIVSEKVRFQTSGGNQYNIRGNNKKWIFPADENPFTLESHRIQDFPWGRELSMKLLASGWCLNVTVKLYDKNGFFSRKVGWTRTGDEPVSITDFQMSIPCVFAEKKEDFSVIHPSLWPPSSVSPKGKTVRNVSTLSRGHMPGAVLYDNKENIAFVYTMQTFKSDYDIVTLTGKGNVNFQSQFHIRTTMKNGDHADSGEELAAVSYGNERNAFASLPKLWETNGFRLKPRPKWTDGAVLYSAYVQGSAWSRHTDIGNFTNFRTGVLPHLKNLGIDILWFNPFNQGRYGVYSYEMEPEVGSEKDLEELCREAGKMNIRVLMDLLPHGPNKKPSPYGNGLGEKIVREHPEWIARNSDGTFKIWWGGYSMDYANPGWQDEMCKLASHYIKNCDISGWRVDCARYSPDNERPTGGRIPSQSGTEGAITMMRRVHEAIDRIKGNCILLGETNTISHLSQMEFIYDGLLGGRVLPDLIEQKAEKWVPLLKIFLQRDHDSLPTAYASGLMRYSENHDTAAARRRYGTGHRDTLISLCFLIPGMPLVNMDQEIGAAILISKLSEIRKRPEFVQGDAEYQNVGSSDPAVLTFLRFLPEQFSAIAINFGGREKNVELTLPQEFRNTKLPFRELIADAPAKLDGGTLKFTIPPYGTRCFSFFNEKQEKTAVGQKNSEGKPEQVNFPEPVLKNSFWNISFRNGFPSEISTTDGTCFIAGIGFVSDHRLIRDKKGMDYTDIGSVDSKITMDSALFNGKWKSGTPFQCRYKLDGKELKIEIQTAPEENAVLELSFGNLPAEWYISTLEGALHDRSDSFHPLGDEFALYEKDLWLREIRITHLVQKSGVLWQADAQPLDPEVGQIAIRRGAQWNGIRFSQSDRALLRDLYLRENGTRLPGLTLRLQPKEGVIRFALRANDDPELSTGILTGRNWCFLSESSRHEVVTQSYSLQLKRNEGGEIFMLANKEGVPLISKSRLGSEDGFFIPNYSPEFGTTTPCPGFSRLNKETAMNISTGDGLKIQFGGELKRSPRRTISALPKVSYSLGYQVQDEKRFDFSASVTPQPRPDLQGGSLAWEFEIPQSIREVIVSDGNQEQKISVSRDKSKVLWKEDASRLKECGSIIFLDNAQQEILKMGCLQFDKLRSLSLETTAKGVPVFRFIFFESEKCDKPETRAFRCRWDVK